MVTYILSINLHFNFKIIIMKINIFIIYDNQLYREGKKEK